MIRLSEKAKQAIIKKVLSNNGQTMSEIALANNIACSTLSTWVSRFKSENSLEAPQKNTQDTETTTPLADRFKHLQATFEQDDAMVGAYCRQHGLYPHQLAQWKADFIMTKNNSQKHFQHTAAEVKALQAEIKELKHTLLRKDKVLAETVALLILKKKSVQFWGGGEED